MEPRVGQISEIGFQKKNFRRESRRDSAKLAPDAIRGTRQKNLPAPAGRLMHCSPSRVCRPCRGLDASPVRPQGSRLTPSPWANVCSPLRGSQRCCPSPSANNALKGALLQARHHRNELFSCAVLPSPLTRPTLCASFSSIKARLPRSFDST